MDSKEILKAIDPKAAEIERLRAELNTEKQRSELLKAEAKALHEVKAQHNWLKENGVMIETPEGMRYLKDEEFDEFMNGLPKWGDSAVARLAQAMQNTKETLAANILNKVFDETYTNHAEHVAVHLQKAEELTNGTNTRKKGKRRSNQSS